MRTPLRWQGCLRAEIKYSAATEAITGPPSAPEISPESQEDLLLNRGFRALLNFFDPYVYREAVAFSSEEAAAVYYLAKLEEQLIYEGADSVAAIVVETVTGSNGVIIPPKGYYPGLRAICDKYNILLICDEVMTGWCRTGKCSLSSISV